MGSPTPKKAYKGRHIIACIQVAGQTIRQMIVLLSTIIWVADTDGVG